MDNALELKRPELGLLGRNISYSFSRGYFAEKFENEELDLKYDNFDIQTIEAFPKIIKDNPQLRGLNVTIPYKESVIPYLDKLSKKAKKIGAVNTIVVTKKGKLKGDNTDWYGFKHSIKPFLKSHHDKALILGTGGASKAIAFALKNLNIKFDYVSRTSGKKIKYTYEDLNEDIIKTYPIIINCTPIGTHPNVELCPDIPYEGITENHLLYDLIYNPQQTRFLHLGEFKGATTINGLHMLQLQAEKSWRIWNLV